ncbi:Basic-leucine zipper domain [Dillenia turbinata]|uniref:Basic-leucine zipper domain n=1 Tax=Dillenia turbinata TaxID=194707 RepID=A0AAN8Z2V7_9MAGN
MKITDESFSSVPINSEIYNPINNYPPNTAALNTYPNYGEPQDHQQRTVNERRYNRMVSNRESARRSRQRKKMQLEDLRLQVTYLQTANSQLTEKLVELLEWNRKLLQENARLKEEASSWKNVTGFLTLPRDPEELSKNKVHVKVDSSSI